MAKTKTEEVYRDPFSGNRKITSKPVKNTEPSMTEPDMAYTVQELFWKMARNEDISHLKRVSSFPIDDNMHEIEDYEKLLNIDLVDEEAIMARVRGRIELAQRELERIQKHNKESKKGVAYRDKNGNLITKEEWLEQNPQPSDPPSTEP